jgi:apolipoprotein N-acyltransferase
MAKPSWARRDWALLWLAALTGPLWFLASPSFDLWPLGWVANVPLLYAVDRAATMRRALLYGWVAGTVTVVGGFYWISLLLTRFAHFPDPLAWGSVLLFGAYHGLVFVLFAWAVRLVRARRAVPLTLLAPIAFAAAELVLPMLFPFHLALSQAWRPHVIQIADLTGPVGVTALLVLASGAIYDTATRRSWTPAAAAAAIVAAALAYGHVRIGQMDAAAAAAPTLKVGLVQGNISFDEKGLDNPNLATDQLHDLQDASRALERAGAELVVWSETSFPFLVPRWAVNEVQVRGVRSRYDGETRTNMFDVPLIFGASTYEAQADGSLKMKADVDPYNSVIYMDRDGRFRGRYDKNYLVLGSEELPLVNIFPGLRNVFPRAAGQLSRGRDLATFTIPAGGKDVRVVPLVCFEDILPVFSRRAAALAPHLLVNVTNDTWFGDTSEPWEHLALAVFRSVELRTWMVRAVNSGVSAFVDSAGRVVKHGGVIDPAEVRAPAQELLGTVALQEGGHTVYAAVGDVFGWGCVAATVLLVVWARRKRG